MASLTGQQIDQTYQGLIKTSANAAVSFPPASLEDGAGNTIGIKLGDGTGIGAGLITQIEGNPGAPGTPSISVDGNAVTIVKLGSLSADGGSAAIIGGNNAAGTFDIFDGTFTFGNAFTTTNVDFTNANITGLPGGAAGLENGTGTDSLQSAASLTTNAADAANLNTIALGDNAAATTDGGISIGHDTRAYGNASSVAIGDDADGHNGGVGIGDGAQAYYGSVAIGKGASSTFTTFGNVHIGEGAKNTTGGNGANVTIGVDATQTSNAEYAIAVGYGSTVSANNAVALGANVTAATADTVSLKALEVQTDSTPTAGGIIISDAGSTDRRINITSAGIPQIDSDPMLVNDSATNTAMTKVWSGTEAQYNALGAYDANTLYYLT